MPFWPATIVWRITRLLGHSSSSPITAPRLVCSHGFEYLRLHKSKHLRERLLAGAVTSLAHFLCLFQMDTLSPSSALSTLGVCARNGLLCYGQAVLVSFYQLVIFNGAYNQIFPFCSCSFSFFAVVSSSNYCQFSGLFSVSVFCTSFSFSSHTLFRLFVGINRSILSCIKHSSSRELYS